MNVHIFQDHLGHYTLEAFKRIEAVSGGTGNVYINIANTAKANWPAQIEVYPQNIHQVVNAIKRKGRITRVYFHNYNFVAFYILKLLRQYDKNIKFIWIFWSGEFYNLPEFLNTIYLGKSVRYIPHQPKNNFVKRQLSRLKSYILGRPVYEHNKLIESYKWIDCLACLFEADYKNITAYSGATFLHQRFAYLSYDQFLAGNNSFEPKTDNDQIRILVNHSADPTLNHADVFERLSKIDVSGKIVLSLAYGDAQYKSEVIHDARMQFKQLEIWEEYTTPQAYSVKLAGIDCAIFNSVIQQGVGNIIVLLWHGAKVFLREENPVYIDLKKWGMHIYSIQQELNGAELSTKLDLEKHEHNKMVLKQYLSDSKVNSYYKTLLEISL